MSLKTAIHSKFSLHLTLEARSSAIKREMPPRSVAMARLLMILDLHLYSNMAASQTINSVYFLKTTRRNSLREQGEFFFSSQSYSSFGVACEAQFVVTAEAQGGGRQIKLRRVRSGRSARSEICHGSARILDQAPAPAILQHASSP